MSEQEKRAFLSSGDILSISEAAELTPYSAEYLSLRARSGKLEAVKVGRNWLTTRNAILKYVRHQRQKHYKMLQALQMGEEVIS